MKKVALIITSAFALSACSQSVTNITDRTASLCGEKPNCVSTQDSRDEHSLAAFELTDTATLDKIELVALSLSGSKTAKKTDNYLRIECTTSIMRFVDDFEVKREGNHLLVRSESRTGYSDFGVNRKRAEKFRTALKEQKLIK
ncbi:DUF1499 domain-containing protein [Vibrio makurazakiensis]|uniref:DUF1499 domain-containing protein n=1 Tax=Vibrio makurazakiensis TaxID=2910250 RepID=UPI003D0A9698